MWIDRLEGWELRVRVRVQSNLTHFWIIFPFHTSWKHQNTFGFLISTFDVFTRYEMRTLARNVVGGRLKFFINIISEISLKSKMWSGSTVTKITKCILHIWHLNHNLMKLQFIKHNPQACKSNDCTVQTKLLVSIWNVTRGWNALNGVIRFVSCKIAWVNFLPWATYFSSAI